MVRLLVAFLLPLAHCQPAQFLGRYQGAEFGQQCVANDRPCEDGVDCCGVCAYIGADTWRCLACTQVSDECIPMGNRCCSGGNKQKDVVVPNAQHSCQATSETSEKYGTTKYTCQAQAVNASSSAAELESNNAAVTLQAPSSAGKGVRSDTQNETSSTTEDLQGLGNVSAEAFIASERPWQIQWRVNHGFCLSADGNRAGNGVKIQLWDCSADFGASGQVWSFHGRQHSLIRAYWDRDYCLVVDGNNYMNGAKIQLWRCDPSNPHQYWSMSDGIIQPANEVSNFMSHCLVVDGNQGFNGAKIQLWECSGRLYQKKWKTHSPY